MPGVAVTAAEVAWQLGLPRGFGVDRAARLGWRAGANHDRLAGLNSALGSNAKTFDAAMPHRISEWRRLSVCAPDERYDLERQLFHTTHDQVGLQLAEAWELPAEDQGEFLDALGLEEPGLHKVIGAAYRALGLSTFFTASEKEARAL